MHHYFSNAMLVASFSYHSLFLLVLKSDLVFTYAFFVIRSHALDYLFKVLGHKRVGK